MIWKRHLLFKSKFFKLNSSQFSNGHATLSVYDPSITETLLFCNHFANIRLVSELNSFSKLLLEDEGTSFFNQFFALCKDFLKSSDLLPEKEQFFLLQRWSLRKEFTAIRHRTNSVYIAKSVSLKNGVQKKDNFGYMFWNLNLQLHDCWHPTTPASYSTVNVSEQILKQVKKRKKTNASNDPIAADEYNSIWVTRAQSTLSSEDDWQYEVETSRSTSQVTTSLSHRKTNNHISLLNKRM